MQGAHKVPLGSGLPWRKGKPKMQHTQRGQQHADLAFLKHNFWYMWKTVSVMSNCQETAAWATSYGNSGVNSHFSLIWFTVCNPFASFFLPDYSNILLYSSCSLGPCWEVKASAIIGAVTKPFYMLHGLKALTGIKMQKSRSQKTFKSLKKPHC